VEAYTEAVSSRNAVRDDFNGLAQRYVESPEFARLAESTRRLYQEHIGIARAEFGRATLAIMSDPRFRADIIEFRDKWSATTRKADHLVQAVSVVLQYGRNLGLLGANLAMGIPSLYSAPGDKRPWTPAEIAQFTDGAPDYILDAFHLIRLLALRRKDAAEIEWSADKGTHTAWKTSKSRSKREAVFPVLPEARAFLDDLRRRNGVKLTNLAASYAKKHKDATPIQTASRYMLIAHRGQRWRDETSITKAFAKRWKELKVEDFPSPHRLRNNAATELMIAGLDERTIADAMGWTLEDVQDMRRVYVDREAVMSAAVIRLQFAPKG
jgi:hypothetical protein